MSLWGTNGSNSSLENHWFTKQRAVERLDELTVVLLALDEAEPGNGGGISKRFQGAGNRASAGKAVWDLWLQSFPREAKKDFQPFGEHS